MTRSDRLLSGADRMVRGSLPVLLDAAELRPWASDLRGLPDLRGSDGAPAAVRALGAARRASGPGLLARALSLAELAVRDAQRGDARSFRDHVGRANEVLRDGLPCRRLN